MQAHPLYAAVRGLDDECDRMSRGSSVVRTIARRGDCDVSTGDRPDCVRDALPGELSVSDMWVVLIKPAREAAEKAASLQAKAKAEQAEINRLLVAVADADNGTARNGAGRCQGLRLRPSRAE